MVDNLKDDFTLGQPEEPRRKKRAPKPPMALEDVTPTVRLEVLFKETFEKRYGFPMGNVLYEVRRDRKILKELVEKVGEVEASALIHDFFFRFSNDRDVRFRTRAGHVPDFKSCWSRLVFLRNGRQPEAVHERTLENRSELSKLLKPKGKQS